MTAESLAERAADIVVNVGLTLWGVAVVWLLAAIFNPNIDSGLVWLLAFIYGGIQAYIALSEIHQRRAVE